MKVRDLDNKISSWSIAGKTITCSNDRMARSELHLNARKLLITRFPTLNILEEVPIYLHGKGGIAYLDFYLPLRKLAIEVQGQQHFKYTPFFHGTINNFLKSKKLDNEKATWCEINGITLIYFSYNETIDIWNSKLI